MAAVARQKKGSRWLDLPTGHRTCEWCSAPDVMQSQLPKYVNVPLDDWPPDLLLDLCYCYDCVQEYHRLQEELTKGAKKAGHKQVLQLVDIDRLAQTITNALEKDVHQKDVATNLQVPLLEILRFPYLLHDKRLADMFKRGLIAFNQSDCLLTVEEKLPGTYLLLVHPNKEVRGWAVRTVRSQGLINSDDYDALEEVIKWMIDVVEFNLFEDCDYVMDGTLPPHLFKPLSIREYWLGLFVLLRQMDAATVQSRFMSSTGHRQLLCSIVSPIQDEENMKEPGAFWPMLQCFVVLLERLGDRMWQIPAFNYQPEQLFKIMTVNCFFRNAVKQWQSDNENEETFSQEELGDSQTETLDRLSCLSDTKYSRGFCKTALAWFQPFVESLLDFDSGKDCLSLVIEYLHGVADDCLRENPFKSDVQAALLRIIHKLLVKRMFVLLEPTVHVWSIDVVNAAILELGDKKVVEDTQRLLQHLLKSCHRLGYDNAFKYLNVLRLSGPKQLSADDKQQIISLLIQFLKEQQHTLEPTFQIASSEFKEEKLEVTQLAGSGHEGSSRQVQPDKKTGSTTGTKQKYTARKSAGRIMKRAPIQQKCGATSKDPIDDEECSAKISDQKGQKGSISKGDDDASILDDGNNQLVLNSQKNALASVEEDLDDLYSTQIQSEKEENTNFSSTGDEDRAVPNEHIHKAKPQKRVSFAIDSSPADPVMDCNRPSDSQTAITKPSRALSENEFFHEILSWKVQNLLNSQSYEGPASLDRTSVPTSFQSMDQYYNTFKPLLFMDVWEQAIKRWEDEDVNKKPVAIDVADERTANGFRIISCSGLLNKQQREKALFPVESDLVLVRLDADDGGGVSNEQSRFRSDSAAVFGFVEKLAVEPARPSRRDSFGSRCGEKEATEVKFLLTLDIKTTSNFQPVRNCRLHVEFVTSLLKELRQWSGLMYLNRSPLACDILRPRKTEYFCSGDYRQSSHVAEDYKTSQERAISTAANAVDLPYEIPRICLVQGYPGTGKSHTIVGLVKEILNRAQETPTRNMSDPAHGGLANKARILLCAPSNAALDELIGRITAARIRLDRRHGKKQTHWQDAAKSAFSNNCGDLRLVWVGLKSHCDPAVVKFSLDCMIKQILENSSAIATEDDLNGIKERLETIDAREKELERTIRRLEHASQRDENQLERWQEEKTDLIEEKRGLKVAYDAMRARKEKKARNEARITRDILDCADVICTTLNDAGSNILKRNLATRYRFSFTCVIVHEACQSSELDLLIPLKFQLSKLVLVGEAKQLPSTEMSVKTKEKLFGRSMFERLYEFFGSRKEEMENPILMLEEQYRMHPEIAAFPSGHFYGNCLKTHRSLEKRSFPMAKHYALFDVVRGQDICQDRGTLWDQAEADLIASLCCDLTKIIRRADSIGIITLCCEQKSEIQSSLADKGLLRGNNTIEVNTVDGFQGREKDVIILSCVRAQNYPDRTMVVSDNQRMNVALTRARHALYVFGHMETLKESSTDWKALVEDAVKRRCLFAVKSPAEVRSVLSIGQTKEIQSPAKDPRLKTKHISAQESDSHGHSSSSNDRVEYQVNTSGDASYFDSAVELNEGEVVLVSKYERQQSLTTGRRVCASTGMHGEISTLKVTISTGSEPSPSKEQRDESASESRRKVVNSTHIGKQEREKHEKEGTRRRDRNQKETKEVQRQRSRSDNRRYDDRRHGNQDSEKRHHNYKHYHRQEHRNGCSKESNHTRREHSRHHSSNRGRVHDRHSDRDCVKGSAYRERQIEPDQSKRRADTKARYPFETTTTSLDKTDADEMDSNNTLEIDTQDVFLHSVIENNATHTQEYFLQLHRQERQLAKTRTSQSDSELLLSETKTSPNETAVTRTTNPGVSTRVETTVTIDQSPGVSTRVSKPTSFRFPPAAPGPSTSPIIHPNVHITHPNGAAVSPSETGWSPAETRTSPTATAIPRTPNLDVSSRVSKPTSFICPLAAPGSSTSPIIHPNVHITHPNGAAVSPSETRWSPAETRTSPTATAIPRTPNLDVSSRVSKPTSFICPLAAPGSSTSPIIHPNVHITHPNGAAVSPNETGWSPGETKWSPAESRTSPTAAATPRAPNLYVSSRVSQPTSRSFSSAASWLSTSNATHQNSPLHSTFGAVGSSSSFSSRPTISRQSSSPPSPRSSTFFGELDPGAQKAADVVRQRHPPAQGPSVIPAISGLGGSRKRKAHAGVTRDGSSLKASASREASFPPKKAAVVPTRRESLKKIQENFRGRKNWK
ncbi:uncharacterized protein LOC144643749 isoform X2 [Oculina patagonica]